MEKTIVLLIAFLAGMSSCFGQNWNRISKAIKEKQEQLYFQLTGEEYKKRETCRHCIDWLQAYHVCRKRLDVLNRLHIDPMNDTIYIMESNFYFNSTIFTRKALVSYNSSLRTTRYRGIPLEITGKPLYYPYMLKLVTRWNLKELKEEWGRYMKIPKEKETVWLTRIILSDKKYTIDCALVKMFRRYKPDNLSDYDNQDLPAILKEAFE